jgi:ASC-1-like (ASCH) protein
MATFDATTTPTIFAQMEAHDKLVYVVPRTPSFDMATAGDRLEFDDLGSITLGAIRRYDSLDALLEGEGVTNVVPGAGSAEEAIATLRATPDWMPTVEAERGVMALRVRSTKRKS